MSIKYELVITADTNDGDYVSNTSVVTMEDIEILLPIIEVIKIRKNYNWPIGDIASRNEMPDVIYKDKLTEEQIELMMDYVPYGEYGIHTITRIEYYTLPEKVRLL